MALNRQALAAALIGAIIGASVMLIYFGKQIDSLNFQLQTSETEKQELEDQNHLLSAKLDQPNKEPVVESIHVQAKAPDGLSQMEIVQFVKQQLEFLKDRPLQTLQDHPDLPWRLLDGRPLTVDQQDYTLHVNTVVISPKLFLVVTATSNSE